MLELPRSAAFLLAATMLAACGGVAEAPRSAPETATDDAGPRIVVGGAPGQSGRVLEPGEASGSREGRHTEADVRFMEMMIPHHEQALEMSALVPDRTERQDIRVMARRIEVSQASEIRYMQRWLTERDEEAPEVDAGHMDHEHSDSDKHAGHHEHGHTPHDHAGMPGMLSPDQMERLADASGAEFERLFLEAMIFHHQGAVLMVRELLASPGAAQEAEIFTFASHVNSDQQAEIARMRALLERL